jgi:hAT family C-terminal dimerisation region
MVRSDQLWMFLFSLTDSPNFKKLVCFLYSLPCSNAYVESAFSHMKHLINDRRGSMTTELVSAELKIRLNSTLSCTELYKYLLDNEDSLRAIKSNDKYTLKKKFNNYIYLCNFFFLILNNKY